MNFVKKFLYWITIIPPVFDIVAGAVKAIYAVWNNTTDSANDNDVRRFINDNK